MIAMTNWPKRGTTVDPSTTDSLVYNGENRLVIACDDSPRVASQVERRPHVFAGMLWSCVVMVLASGTPREAWAIDGIDAPWLLSVEQQQAVVVDVVVDVVTKQEHSEKACAKGAHLPATVLPEEAGDTPERVQRNACARGACLVARDDSDEDQPTQQRPMRRLLRRWRR